MKDKLRFITDFRNDFKKRFYVDVTGFANVMILMIISVLFLPLVAVYFSINIYYFFVMLQTANMVFTLWVWNEVKNKKK